MPKPTLPIEDDRIIETVVRLLGASGEAESAAILRTWRCRFEQTGYDNWDGGTAIHTLYVQVAPENHALLGSRRAELEKVITARLREAITQFSKDWYSAELVPLVVTLPARPDLKGGPVSPRTRRSILGMLRIEEVAWQGRLSDSDFLAPLFDLKALPSTDERFGDARRYSGSTASVTATGTGAGFSRTSGSTSSVPRMRPSFPSWSGSSTRLCARTLPKRWRWPND